MTTQDESDFPKLSAPARRALERAGYAKLDQLAGVKKPELAKLHGMGPSAIKALTDALNQRGLSLGA